MDQPLITQEPHITLKDFFSRVEGLFDASPFKPHSIFTGGHAQTLAAYGWPRIYRLRRAPIDDRRFFEVEADVKILANCRWHTNPRSHPTLVAWHGMEGSIRSVYMVAIADKAFRAGFNVVRVNYRNCGGTEHLTKTLYHGGMSGDLKKVVEELISKDGVTRLYMLGFSLGGNMVLKLAGEYGTRPPRELRALCVVSPSVDLKASTDLIVARKNRLYNRSFVQSLKNKVRVKHKLYPTLYDLDKLSRVKTIRDFDEEFTSQANGFADANDYYHRASSLRVADHIRIPGLIIHAKDDPFIPFEPLTNAGISANPYLMTVATDSGGHVGFISRNKRSSEDRFWAENRVVEFFRLAEKYLPR